MSEAIVRVVNITLLVIGCTETIIIACSFRRDTLRNRSQKILFAKIAVSGMMMFVFALYYYRGAELRDPLNVMLLSLACTGVYTIYYLYIRYLSVQMAELDPEHPVRDSVPHAALVICVIGTIIWILSSVDDGFRALNDMMVKTVSFEAGHIGGLMLICMTLGILFRHRRTMGLRHTLILSSMPVLMAAATFIEPHVHGIELHYPAILTEIIIVYTQHHMDIEMQIEKDEMAGTRAKLAMATGRMKPHYLYNVLTTIYYLCESDPLKAQHAIGTFSEYLRSTLETMKRQELVTFSWELSEIRHYLELEKLRFGSRLNIDYDVEYEDFLVPPLSIQPLVENAVKHGIAAKEEGGTVRIITRKLSDGGAQIRINDDGDGFDVETLKGLDSTHEGVANVRERIRLEMGGDMTITSAPGRGTTVMVTLRPQDGGGN